MSIVHCFQFCENVVVAGALQVKFETEQAKRHVAHCPSHVLLDFGLVFLFFCFASFKWPYHSNRTSKIV